MLALIAFTASAQGQIEPSGWLLAACFFAAVLSGAASLFLLRGLRAESWSCRLGSAARLCGLVLFLSAGSLPAPGQSNRVTPNNQTGLAPYNTYDGDHENVNLATSDLNLQLPLASLPGRDHHDLTVSLIYDNRLYDLAAAVDPTSGFLGWYWVAYWTGAAYWSGNTNGGWRLNFPGLSKSQHCDQLGDGSFDVYFSDFIVTLGDGAKHHFANKVAHTYYSGTQASCQGGLNVSHTPWGDAGGYSGDGSLLYFDTSNATNAVLRFKDGSSIVFYNYLTQVNQIDWKDNNGNVISYLYNSSGNISAIQDSLGRVITIGYSSISYGSGLAEILPTSITYRDANGVQRTTTIAYSVQTMTPAFSQPPAGSLIANAVPSGPAPLLTSVTLPNGRSYTMQYNNFAELTKITYPAGGYTRYAYGAVQGWYVLNNNSTSGDVRVVTNSYACSNASGSCSAAQELVTTYNATRGPANSNNTAITVTDMLGNYSTYTFSDAGAPQAWVADCEPPSPRELTRAMYNNSGKQFRSVATDYNTSPNCGNGTTYMLPIRRTTTLDNGLVTKTEWDYETLSSAPSLLVDNVVEERVFDYGMLSTPAVKHRFTYLQVNPVNNVDYTQAPLFVLDRKASEQVYDSHTGSDVLMAQTTYEYDNYTAGVAPSGATQHDSAFAASYTTRGNVTAVNHWRNTDGASLTTRNQYDDAGNVLQTTDPLGHSTSFSYADSWADSTCAPSAGNASAYVTKTTNALAQTATSTYNSCTGSVQAHQDQNDINASRAGTTYTYDLLGRPLSKSLADGGQLSMSYNDVPPVSTTSTTKLTSALNIASTTVRDGLGRTTQTQLTSDPQGVDYTDTTYDALGRVSTVSNPYRSTSDPTYGITSTQYDALGRPTQVTKQDSSVVTTQYDQTSTNSLNANCSVTTDEAGSNARAVWTDWGV